MCDNKSPWSHQGQVLLQLRPQAVTCKSPLWGSSIVEDMCSPSIKADGRSKPSALHAVTFGMLQC